VAARDYRIVVSRGEDWRRARFWPVSVQQKLPIIGIPLRGKDPDAPLDLNAVLRTSYNKAEYDATLVRMPLGLPSCSASTVYADAKSFPEQKCELGFLAAPGRTRSFVQD
jgi:hypothetical protein